MRFKVVVTGWNCSKYVRRSMDSLAAQTDPAVDVFVVDDASDQEEQPRAMAAACRQNGWHFRRNRVRKGALFNQYEAVHALGPTDEDVVVFLDADDRLAHPRVLERLRDYYCRHRPLMTYGSYRCDPEDLKVTPALPFPHEVVAANAYRRFSARDDPDAIWFNHLRTVTYGLFRRLGPTDFCFADGSWFMACCDTAVMVPCLEMAAGRHLVIPEVLYVYTRDNPVSDCRVNEPAVRRANRRILHETTPREPLYPVTRPPVAFARRSC